MIWFKEGVINKHYKILSDDRKVGNGKALRSRTSKSI